MSLRARVVGGIVLVVALAVAASAYARGGPDIHFNARVRSTLDSDQMEYYGRARSNTEACQVGRTVRITTPGRLIGQVATKANGRFSLVADEVADGSTVKFKLTRNGRDCPSQTVFVEL